MCAEQRKDGGRQRTRRHGQHVQPLPPDRASTGMPECSPCCRLQMSRGRFVLILYLYLRLFNPSVTQHPASSTLPRFSLAHSLPFDGTEEESHVILILRLRVPLQWPEPGLLSQKPTPRLKSEIPKAREEATLVSSGHKDKGRRTARAAPACPGPWSPGCPSGAVPRGHRAGQRPPTRGSRTPWCCGSGPARGAVTEKAARQHPSHPATRGPRLADLGRAGRRVHRPATC